LYNLWAGGWLYSQDTISDIWNYLEHGNFSEISSNLHHLDLDLPPALYSMLHLCLLYHLFHHANPDCWIAQEGVWASSAGDAPEAVLKPSSAVLEWAPLL